MLPKAVSDQFDDLSAWLSSFLSTSFNNDGTLIQQQPGLNVIGIGDVIPTAAATARDGFLLCDGSAVNRVQYKDLFQVIGATYGAGDGSTTFNVPDLRGRFPLGKAGTGTGATLGSTGGAIDHTHTGPSHVHGLTAASTASAGAHDHGAATGNESAHTHSLTIDSGLIVLRGGTPGIYDVTTPGGNAHSHLVTGNTDAGSAHSHSISSDGAHTHTVSGSTDAAGAGSTGTANPPFIAINYLIFTGRKVAR
jgi:microcystin-dependent protein